MKRLARHAAGRAGYRLVGSGGLRHLGTHRLQRTRPLPAEVQATGKGVDGPFTIPIDKVTTPVAFSFAPEGWHPYLPTLREYIDDRRLPYEQSTLARYYATYRPGNAQEALLDDVDEPIEPLASWPPLLHLFKHIWALNPTRVRQILRNQEREKGLRQQFGPQDQAFGELQIRRLVAVYESVALHGYRPDDYPGDQVMGYFVVGDDDYRFVALHGNHRIPAFRLLGVDNIVAVTHWAHPPVIDDVYIQRWTSGRRRVLDPETARLVLNKLLTETGADKARRLRLN